MKIATKKGFTLLEVLVAMTILAIGMLTLFNVSNQYIVQTSYLKDKTIAQWVAMNKINEVKLKSNWPDKGSSNGVVEMANQDWYWKLKVSDYGKQIEKVRILTVEVRLHDKQENSLVDYVSFVSQ